MGETGLTPQSSCVPQLLRAQALRTPDAVAILAPGRVPLAYGRLWRHVEGITQTLNALGLDRHARVAMVLPTGPEAVVALLSIVAGAIAVPLNPAYRVHEFDRYLSDLNAQALLLPIGVASPARAVAQAQGIPVINLAPLPKAEAGLFTLTGARCAAPAHGGVVGSDDVALVLHTSGTTAHPKRVPLTHANLCASARDMRMALGLEERDRYLNVMPLFHIHGFMATLSSLVAGGSVACPPEFDATEFFAWVDALRPTWYSASPAIHQAVLAEVASTGEDLSRHRFRFIRSAAAPLPPQVMAKLEEVFRAPVIETYGQTETSFATSNPLPAGRRKPGSAGIAAGPEVGIIDETASLLPPGAVGEIVVRGPNVMPGYEGNAGANAAAFTEGWFRTGDQGFLDPEGYLFITSRLKEIINRGGEKISPREVDEALLNHPAVAQAVTFPIPHPTLGEDVAAAVVLRGNGAVTERDLRSFAATLLADFKVPRRVLILNNIPKGPTGKPDRSGLVERLGLAGPAGVVADPGTSLVSPRTPLERVVAHIWGEVLGRGSLGVHDDFLEMEGDSLQAARILARLQELLGVELPATVLFEAPTVAAMTAAIAKKLEGTAKAAEIARIVGQVDRLSDWEAQRLLAGEASESPGRQGRP